MLAPALLMIALAGASAMPVPRVVSVEPSAQEIPATTLRFYVTFDRSARGLVPQDRVTLLTADGHALPSPFMDFGQELWSSDGRRLTVLIDPGRIKRDVAAPGAEASPLQSGSRYQIAIGTYRQEFLAGPPLRRPLDPKQWLLSRPEHPGDPVTLVFDRVMDSALLLDQLVVVTAGGRSVPGRIEVSGGTTWRFFPDSPWTKDSYIVLVNPVLEDVSGNRVGEALDHDAGETYAEPDLVRLPFSFEAH